MTKDLYKYLRKLPENMNIPLEHLSTISSENVADHVNM
jgi:hypothetical protein